VVEVKIETSKAREKGWVSKKFSVTGGVNKTHLLKPHILAPIKSTKCEPHIETIIF
jgi:hypothetical protein